MTSTDGPIRFNEVRPEAYRALQVICAASHAFGEFPDCDACQEEFPWLCLIAGERREKSSG